MTHPHPHSHYHHQSHEAPHAKHADHADHKGKGKQRERPTSSTSEVHPAVTSALEEALSTPLIASSPPSSVDSPFASSTPISRPPLAFRPPSFLPMPPRLFSDLARSTMPTASLTYASVDHRGKPKPRITSPTTSRKLGESSTALHTTEPLTYGDEPFPDLDPSTGLPLESPQPNTDTRSLHLQRTITDLLSAPRRRSADSASSSILPSISLPKVSIPSLPSRSSLDFSGTGLRRSLSSSAPNEDWGSWATGWWGGNKKKVDETLAEEDQADTVEEEKEKHRRKYRSPRNPVVFCHGLLGFDYVGPTSLPSLQISHWRGIREVLEANGTEVLITRVAATASIADRAATLEELISEKYPGREVNLIGHSMGGLDCRYLVSQTPKGFKPVSLTTISTPHRGSPFADYVIDNVIGRDRLPSLLSLMETMRLPQSGDGSAFNALGTKSMRMFNAEVIDRPDVKYYSWGASFEPGLFDTFRWPHSVILAKEGPNDGLVSVQSARWGEYRGTLLGVNHLDLVGWVNHVRYVLSGWTGNPISFKPATFYLEVADYLAEQGF